MADIDDAKDRVTLALLGSAAKAGASDEGILALLAKLSGEPMVSCYEKGRGLIQVKVRRVHAIHTPHDDPDATVLTFTEINPMDPRYQITVDQAQHKVARSLRAAGWEH